MLADDALTTIAAATPTPLGYSEAEVKMARELLAAREVVKAAREGLAHATPITHRSIAVYDELEDALCRYDEAVRGE